MKMIRSPVARAIPALRALGEPGVGLGHDRKPAAGARSRPLDRCGRPIGRPVVDEHDLVRRLQRTVCSKHASSTRSSKAARLYVQS